MGVLSYLAKKVAATTAKKVRFATMHAKESQQGVFNDLLKTGKGTAFGKEHNFDQIHTYKEFKQHVPLVDYEGMRPYIDRILAGENDVLWRGKPIYLSKTSGTTSGVKYIPITKDSISNQIAGARNALLFYIHETGNAAFLNGKLIFLSGSPTLEKKGGILYGRLSGIVNHHVPGYLRRNQMPSYETNCIEDWETKVDTIVDETINQDMTLISGIPPWVQMYFDKLIERNPGKQIKDIFPNFSLYVYGGVNFEPYRAKMEKTIGKRVDSIETYPASEGFIAYQNSQKEEGLLLIVDDGIFYEFIPADEFFNENPTRLQLTEVKVGVNYAIVLNTNAGLWGYVIGDTVKFISTEPYKILVTGRIKHFTSAFGEHVIAEEVEYALKQACETYHADVVEFTVAPQVTPPQGGLPYHEWFIEFSNPPADMAAFSASIDAALQKKNTYYKDLITGAILRPLVLTALQKDAFINYMKAEGKLGGQNKVPRLSNDRKIAEKLSAFSL